MKVNEYFLSIQGEGWFAGHIVLFVRLSGCNRRCSWCDTEFDSGEELSVDELVNIINNTKADIIVWTGGEPLLQYEGIKKVHNLVNANKRVTEEKIFHLETNGDLLTKEILMDNTFDYIACSPKIKETAAKVKRLYEEAGLNNLFDIKVVTEAEEEGMDMIEYATLLMPLTTEDSEANQKIKQNVWELCIEKKIKYCPRLHYEVWGSKRGV